MQIGQIMRKLEGNPELSFNCLILEGCLSHLRSAGSVEQTSIKSRNKFGPTYSLYMYVQAILTKNP